MGYHGPWEFMGYHGILSLPKTVFFTKALHGWVSWRSQGLANVAQLTGVGCEPRTTERVLKYQMPQELIWQCVKTLVPLVNPKIAGTWMFIPKKNVFIGIDTSPYQMPTKNHMPQLLVAPKKSRCARDILLVFTMESPRSCQRFCPPGCAITLGGIEKKSSKDQHLKWWTDNELIMKWR